MLTYLRNILIAALSRVLPGGWSAAIFRWWHGRLFDEIDGKATNATLQAMLFAMEWGLRLVPHWRKRIQGFKGTIVFAAKSPADEKREVVQATAVFDGQQMKVLRDEVGSFDVKVAFSDPNALFAFLMSRNHDIVDALLTNSVETTGNLNYVYRFGFLAIEMTRWLPSPA